MIGLDVMGGDFSPAIPVQAALKTIQKYKIPILLIGDKPLIEEQLKEQNHQSSLLDIFHTEDFISMEDSVMQSVRKKKSSLYRAFELHKENKIQGVVSAGNSAAFLAIGKSILKSIEGIDRPCISAVMPNQKDKFVLLDAGANADCDAKHLLQFSILGSIYATEFLGIAKPKVALLNVGSEEGKGNRVVKEAYGLLQKAPIHFIGNIEGKNIFSGDVDVIVTDGFSGNILLKSVEGTVSFMKNLARKHFTESLKSKVGIFFLRESIKKIQTTIDYAEYGGAPLLGLNGVAIVCHGASRDDAIVYALRLAQSSADCGYISQVKRKINNLHF